MHAKRGWLARQVLTGHQPRADVQRHVSDARRRGAPRAALAPNVPEAVARQLVEHTWPAYHGALSALLDNNPVPEAIARPRRPTTVVLGDADRETPAEDVLNGPHSEVRVEVSGSDHLLPLRHADRLAELVASEATRTT